MPTPSTTAPSPFFAPWAGELVRRHRRSLLQRARREGLGAEDAFDCVQEAFLLLLTDPAARPGDLSPEEAARYLAAAVRNLARNGRRLHARARPHDEEGLDVLADERRGADELVAQAEAQAGLLACVRRLERMQRAVVTLRLLDDLPGESAASELGLTAGHVAVLLHRAKASLRRCLEQPGTFDVYP